MAKIIFTHKAKNDLEEIWQYTYETWSENQADKYYKEIIESCHDLKSKFNMGKDYSKIYENLKSIKCSRHLIFYRLIKKDLIEIERILHEKMDIDKHLNK